MNATTTAASQPMLPDDANEMNAHILLERFSHFDLVVMPCSYGQINHALKNILRGLDGC